MIRATTAQPQAPQGDPGTMARIGGWLFKHRTWLPAPLVLALLVLPGGAPHPFLGPAVVALGELIRLWAVRHIGVISRTRRDRLGPLVSTGPFALVRNPLYLANIAIWVGFALCAGMTWMAPLIIAVLGFEYHAIVLWEERLLAARRGDQYRVYAERVPRWFPRVGAGAGASPHATYSWSETLFSERGTLVAIAVGSVMLYMKARNM